MFCEMTDVWLNEMYGYVYLCPVYYHENILEVWLTLNPRYYGNDTKSFVNVLGEKVALATIIPNLYVYILSYL